jgi:hypothetical protein
MNAGLCPLELRKGRFSVQKMGSTTSPMCFPQFSGVSAHLKKRIKQAENEKSSYRIDLTPMVS